MKPVRVRPHQRRAEVSHPSIYLRRDPATGPNEEARSVARAYARSIGRTLPPPRPRVKADPQTGRNIAEAYRRLRDNSQDPEVQVAYRHFADEVLAQWEFVKPYVAVEFTATDPYPNSAAMMQDIRENKRLKVYTGGPPHPFMSQIIEPESRQTANNIFRAVHDFFGHAKEGNQFGANGEENAWRDHSAMFSLFAQRAMTTETRGQNSFYNWSPENEGKPHSERTFAPQKVDLLPSEYWPEGR